MLVEGIEWERYISIPSPTPLPPFQMQNLNNSNSMFLSSPNLTWYIMFRHLKMEESLSRINYILFLLVFKTNGINQTCQLQPWDYRIITIKLLCVKGILANWKVGLSSRISSSGGNGCGKVIFFPNQFKMFRIVWNCLIHWFVI